MATCRDYCDEACTRPAGHEPPHYGEYGTIWRAATPEEQAEFEAEAQR